MTASTPDDGAFRTMLKAGAAQDASRTAFKRSFSDEMKKSLSEFEEQRQADRLAYLHIVRVLGITLLAVGGVVHGCTHLLSKLGYGSEPGVVDVWAVLTSAARVLGSLMAVCGIMVVSTTPVHELDVDSFSQHRAKAMMLLWVSMFFHSFRHLSPLSAFTCAVGLVQCFCCRGHAWVPWPTTLLALWHILLVADVAWSSLLIALLEDCDYLAVCRASSSVFAALGLCVMVSKYCIWRYWRLRCPISQESDRSLAVVRMMHYYWAIHGMMLIVSSVATRLYPAECTIAEGEKWLNDIENLTRGVPMFAVPLTISIVGRDRVFNIVACRFDRNPERAKRGGAFLASLLESIPLKCGDTWWVHHGLADARVPTFDPRRNWHKGRVVSVSGDEAVVLIDAPQLASEGSKRSDPLTRLRQARTLQRMGSSSNGDAGDADIHRVRLTSLQASPEELFESAQRELHCIEWQSMSKDLIATSAGDMEGYALTREVKATEKIDYFMSHSWHDDPEAKWQALNSAASKFLDAKGRYPTFWLDKVCIDQSRIGDGLRVLPVNVMACSKVLVLCGETYPTRLWCMWELVTLFSLVSEAEALRRVVFVPLASEDSSGLIERIKNFRVSQARCYDPNEEAKLFKVIYAVGEERFNQRVRALAELVHQGCKLRSFSFSSSVSEPVQSTTTDFTGESVSEPVQSTASDFTGEAFPGSDEVVIQL